MVRHALVFGLLVTTTCQLFPDLTGLGATDAAVVDSPSVDASEDALQDVTDDVAPDAGDASDSGAWCATQDASFILCADFDESTDVTQGFDSEGQVGVGGSISIDTSTYVSAPRSAFAIANPFAAGQTTGDRLIKSLWSLGTTPGAVDCATQWDPIALSTTPNDYAHVITIALYSDTAETQALASYNINVLPTGSLVLLEFYPNTPGVEHTISTTITTTTWKPVTLSISASSQMYTASYGVSSTSGPLAKPVPTPSHATIEVGPAYFGGSTTAASPGWTFGYDNVVCH